MDASKVARLSILVADASAERRTSIAESARGFGARDVTEVRSLSAAIDWLGQHTVDILICGEHLEDQHGAVLLDAARRASPATRAVLLPDDDVHPSSDPDLLGGLTLPATQTVLKMMLQSAVAPGSGFWCQLPDLSLPDILQLYHQSRRSITVLVSGHIAGRIRLEGGELVHAETENLVGVPALCRLLSAKTGLVRTEMSIFDGKETIHAPFHGLMLEAMDQIDDRPTAHAEGTGSLDENDFDVESLFQPTLEPVAAPPRVELQVTAPPRPKRRRAAVAFFGALAALVAVGLLVMFLTGRGDPPARDAFERDAHAASPVVSSVASMRPAERELVGETRRLRRVSPDVEEVPNADMPLGTGATRPSPAQRGRGEPGTNLGHEALGPAPAEPALSTFKLHIASVPSRVSVMEGGKLLGMTPLTIPCERSQLALKARQFVLSAKGYEPHALTQATSDTDVEVSVMLTPIKNAAPAPLAAPSGTAAASTAAANTPAANTPAANRAMEIRLQR